MTTGQRIKAARKKAGMTQEDFGKKLGLSSSFIAQYETDNRKPKQETLMKIAKALGVRLSDLSDASTWDELDRQEGVERLSESVAESSILDTVAKAYWEFAPELVALLSKLNDDGQQEAVKRVGELTEIPRYQKK